MIKNKILNKKEKKKLHHRNKKIAALTLTAVLALSGLAGCGTTSSSDSSTTEETGTEETSAEDSSLAIDTSDMFTDRDLSTDYEVDTTITLKDDGSTADGDGVEIDGNTITITKEGTYEITGTLTDGQIIIDANDAKVQLVLNNVSLTTSSATAIYAKDADKVFITAAEGSTNTVTATGEDETDSDNDKNLDGAIFATCDITMNGSGKITISSTNGSGIVGKDDVRLCDACLIIKAGKHGVDANDSIRVSGGKYSITCTEDGLHCADDDAENPFIYVADGTFKIKAGDDGMHADGLLQIDNGKITVVESYEGLEGLQIVINDGTIDITASDDGMNAAGGNDSSGFGPGGGMGGFFGGFGHGSDQSSDDSSSDQTSDAATTDNSKSDIDTSTADKSKASSDTDSDSTATDSSSDSFASTADPLLTINGGTITVNADGDGLDSNGDMVINGGEVYVSGPTNDGNTALDFGDGANGYINGGIVIASGSSGMAEQFSEDSEQCVMLVTFDDYSTDTITLTDADGNVLCSMTPQSQYNCVIISCPDITEDGTYTVASGDTTQEITMDGKIYGEASGMGGGMAGGMGGHGNHGQDASSDQSGNSDMPQPSEDFDPSQMDEDFDPSQMDEDFDPSQMGEKPDMSNMPQGGKGQKGSNSSSSSDSSKSDSSNSSSNSSSSSDDSTTL